MKYCAIALKYVSNFWRFLDLQIIICETKLDLSLKNDCLLIEHHNSITEVNFMITSTKLNVPVVTLSVNNCYKIKSKDLKDQFFGRNIHLKQQPKQKTIIYLI